MYYFTSRYVEPTFIALNSPASLCTPNGSGSSRWVCQLSATWGSKLAINCIPGHRTCLNSKLDFSIEILVNTGSHASGRCRHWLNANTELTPNGHPLPGYLPPGYQPVHPSDGPVEGMLPPTSDCHGLLDWIGLEVERVNATTRIRSNSPCSVFPSILQWASDLSQGLLQLVGGIEPLRLMHLELSGQSGLQSQYRLELGKQSSIQHLLQRGFSVFRHKNWEL